MAQLIHIRNRIKTIETIQKVTHAMRLISMSSHSRLRLRTNTLKKFLDLAYEQLQLIMQTTDATHPFLIKHKNPKERLVIIIGSQKGLCGSFNNNLANFVLKQESVPASYILIGKRIIHLLQNSLPGMVIRTQEAITSYNFIEVAESISSFLLKNKEMYQSVVVYSNYPRSFFTQDPIITHLIPFDSDEVDQNLKKEKNLEDITWDTDPQTILNAVIPFCLVGKIQSLFHQSLSAEYAARFISMDNSTRNASVLLEESRLIYNKLRQAKITKELAELSGCHIP